MDVMDIPDAKPVETPVHPEIVPPVETVQILPAIEIDPHPTDLVAHFDSGVFTVGETGKVSVDFLYDGGGYKGQLAIFSLKGMESFDPDSTAFIHEAATRALSNSNLGHILIDDLSQAAHFASADNGGQYLGEQSFAMQSGDRFGMMLVPNGTVQTVFDTPDADGEIRPLFSMATANPNDAYHVGQIADVFGDGKTFVFEDLRFDKGSDGDYNDLVFHLKGATGKAVTFDQLIADGSLSPSHDWRGSDLGHQIESYVTPPVPISEVLPTPISQSPLDQIPSSHQPLIAVIDTGVSANNPDLNYQHLILGHDYLGNDANPLLNTGEGSEHGTHVIGLIGAIQDNGQGIDGANNDAQIMITRAVGSGKWADALNEIVSKAQELNKENVIVNLSFDLTQIDSRGVETTRYEFTPLERAAIDNARQHGVLLVAAAGNNGGLMSVLGQASQEFDNIITVGASDGLDRAAYSNFGEGLDILVDGGTSTHKILSTVGDGVGEMAGTSVATARATGAISQVWASNPNLSYRQVIDIIKSSAIDLKSPGWDVETGAGLLNLPGAISLATATKGEVYNPLSFSVPNIWGGAGLVTPQERAVDFKGVIQRIGDTVSTGWLRIRSGAGTNYSEVAKINTGTELIFEDNPYSGGTATDLSGLGSSNQWYRLVDGRGYMSALYIQNLGSVSTPPPNPITNPPYIPPTQPTPEYWQTAIDNEYNSTNNQPKGYNGDIASMGYPTSGYLSASTSPQGTSGYYRSYSNGTVHWTSQYGAVALWGGFNSLYSQSGGSSSWLGFPTKDEFDWNGGRRQEFEGGYFLWNPSTGSTSMSTYPVYTPPVYTPPAQPTSTVINGYTIGGNFYPVYMNYRGTLGNPNSNAQYHPQTGASYQTFDRGSIVSSGYGTFPIYGGIRQEYLRTGGLNGFLGAPMTGEVGVGNGVIVQRFYGGYIIWNGSKATAYRNNQSPITLPPSDKVTPQPTTPNINYKSFTGWVMPSQGVALRNSPSYNDRSGKAEPYGKWLSFDAWTNGDTVNDYQVGTPDSRWFRVAGTNYWVPSAYIYGNPQGLPGNQKPNTGTTPVTNPPNNSTTPFPSNSSLQIPVNFNSRFYREDNPFWRAGYEGQCTWYVNGRLKELGFDAGKANKMLGNAKDWDNQAANAGIAVSNTPKVGAVTVWEANRGGAGNYGHVGIVERINADGSILISESNWAGKKYNTRTIYPGQSGWPSHFIHVPFVQSTSNPPVTTPAPVQPNPTILSGSKQLQFNLNKTSLWGAGNQGLGFDLQGQFNMNDERDLGLVDFNWYMKGSAGAYLSSGQAEIKLPSLFNYQYNDSSDTFKISSSIGGGETLLSTYLAAGASFDFEMGLGLKLDNSIPWIGGSGLSGKVGFELDGADVLLGLLPGIAKFMDIDTGLNTVDRDWSQQTLKAIDTAGVKFDVTKALGDLKFGNVKAQDFLTAEVAVNIEQTSIFDVSGFKFDRDNINSNGNEFTVIFGGGEISQVVENLSNLRVQPIAKLNTTILPKLEGSAGVSIQKAIDKLIPESTRQWVQEMVKVSGDIKLDLSLTIPNLQYKVDEFNPFEKANYWMKWS